MSASSFARLTAAVAVLALCVILLGAYVRLSDAGLGCPDWPGCYGHMVVPSADHAIAAANEAHPARPLDSGKAWKEMVHRYLAGSLGLGILAIAAVAWRNRRLGRPVVLPILLVALVVFQALLGMWTVTLLVNPTIVTAHLAGGMATLGEPFSLADRLRHLLLPTLVLATANLAELTRYTRSSMIAILGEDYVRTAHAKGLLRRTVLLRHALRAALIPVVTVIGVLLPRAVGGAAITETVSSWPGWGGWRSRRRRRATTRS